MSFERMQVHAVIESTMGVGRLDSSSPVYSYGFNSILFIECVTQVESQFGVTIDLDRFSDIDESTLVGELVSKFLSAMGESGETGIN